MVNSTNARIVKVKDVDSQEERAWRELGNRALEPNPYFEPDFVMTSAKHLDAHAETMLVVAYEGDTFRGVLPVVKFERAKVPPRVMARTGTTPSGYRALGTPLIDPVAPDLVVGALLDALHDCAMQRGWPGILFMDLVGSDGPVMESFRRACKTRGFPLFTKDSWERGMVHRGGTWEHPLSKSRERQIAKGRRRLVREKDAEVKLVDRTRDPAVIEEFLVMEAAGWKGKDGGWAVAKDARKSAWLREWYERWCATGRLAIFSLEVGDVPIAIQICVRAGDGIFLFREAYDESYSKYGPGAMIIGDTMQHLLEHTDAQWVDSGTDEDNAFLSEMLPEHRTLSTLYVGVGGSLDRKITAALPAMTKLVAASHEIRNRWSRARASQVPPSDEQGPPSNLEQRDAQ